MKQSAGLLPFRRTKGGLEVLLVHPGGPWFAKRDHRVWSIAKGEFTEGEESPFEAALREFHEETGLLPHSDAEFIFLGVRRQAGGKCIHAYAVEAEFPEEYVTSNTFTMEWPPGSGCMQSFPEVDRATWFPLKIAEEKLIPGQDGFLIDLVRALALDTPPQCRPKTAKRESRRAAD
ncbi:NUDIX domain-containing protein [Desulfovibrio inopinatus]|uniref:NUDIX domain-containing protein n=1 Tax=Desulfovibrio inopinatus TaxID=102109 RepID=UPI000422A754|nr:NUDIX domain-containing protein [Desulfovibrio inopinatus]